VMVTTILIVWGVIGAISMLSSLYIIMTGNEGKVTPKGQAIPLLIVTTMMIFNNRCIDYEMWLKVGYNLLG
jgi:hypothetical protein